MKYTAYLAFTGLCVSLTSCLAPVWQTLNPVSNPDLLQQHFGKPVAPNSVPMLTDESPSWYLDQRKYIFAGIPQRIQLPPIAKGFDITAHNARINPDPLRLGYYILEADMPNITATIVIRQNVKMESEEQIINIKVLPIPMPELRIPNAQQGKVLVKDMRQLSRIELPSLAYGANEAVAIQCACKGFQLTRIGADNSKESATSVDGSLHSGITEVLAKADKGDIYLFQKMRIQCSEKESIRTMPNIAFEVE